MLELDVMDVRIVEERSYADNMDSYSAHRQKKHFLYFTDEKIFCVLMEICRNLGTSKHVLEHIDHAKSDTQEFI